MNSFTSIEICAGAGGQALGLEQAGFEHLALVEWEPLACETLRHNRPQWNVVQGDVRAFSATSYKGGVDLFAGGVPCPPFSIAGKQLGQDDERDLFPEALRLIEECSPRAILLENVRGLLSPKFTLYRQTIQHQLAEMGYWSSWRVLNASDFGVPQLRPRAILVGLKRELMPYFDWPSPIDSQPVTVGHALVNHMREAGWELADAWKLQANGIAPTLVGGSKKHGGADLGPTRARKAWASLGVDGGSLSNFPPQPGDVKMPKLTLAMAATIQGFPESWHIVGKKTPAYRQVGNAFPPPVAKAVGEAIKSALQNYKSATTQPDEWKNRQKDKAQRPNYGPIFTQG